MIYVRVQSLEAMPHVVAQPDQSSSAGHCNSSEKRAYSTRNKDDIS